MPVARAAADVASIAMQLERQYPGSNRDRGATVLPLAQVIAGDIRPVLLILLAGAGLLLLIACVNVASLLLVRAERRKREIAIRGALGASRARLIQQFATEGVVLVAGAGALGLAFAHTAMHLLVGLIPATRIAQMPFLEQLGLSARVLLFACAVSAVMGLLFAIVPLLRLSAVEMREGLAEGGRGSAGTVWRRLGAHLVVIELATAMVLLAGAGLLALSFSRLIRVDTGLQPDRLAILRVAPPDDTKPERIVALERRITDRVRGLPGMTSVGTTVRLPISDTVGTIEIRAADRPLDKPVPATNREISASYFRTLGARLVRGRDFTETDDGARPRVAIVNQTLARQLFADADADPIGRRLEIVGEPEAPVEVVGIVEDIKEGRLDAPAPAAIYVPFAQYPFSRFYLVVRTAGEPGVLLPTLAATVRAIDPSAATYAQTVMRDRIDHSPVAYMHRTSAELVGAFAVVALLLGSVGLYGVIAYSVGQRTREIGVRLALGATRGSVHRLVLADAARLTLLGIALGLAGAVAAASVLRTLLFGVSLWDAPGLLAVAVVLAVSSLLASYVPARRAASIDPIDALRPS